MTSPMLCTWMALYRGTLCTLSIVPRSGFLRQSSRRQSNSATVQALVQKQMHLHLKMSHLHLYFWNPRHLHLHQNICICILETKTFAFANIFLQKLAFSSKHLHLHKNISICICIRLKSICILKKQTCICILLKTFAFDFKTFESKYDVYEVHKAIVEPANWLSNLVFESTSF